LGWQTKFDFNEASFEELDLERLKPFLFVDFYRNFG